MKVKVCTILYRQTKKKLLPSRHSSSNSNSLTLCNGFKIYIASIYILIGMCYCSPRNLNPIQKQEIVLKLYHYWFFNCKIRNKLFNNIISFNIRIMSAFLFCILKLGKDFHRINYLATDDNFQVQCPISLHHLPLLGIENDFDRWILFSFQFLFQSK